MIRAAPLLRREFAGTAASPKSARMPQFVYGMWISYAAPVKQTGCVQDASAFIVIQSAKNSPTIASKLRFSESFRDALPFSVHM